MRKQKVINIVAAAAVIAGGVVCIAEQATFIGLPQYAFNYIYFLIICPLAVHFSSIGERANPDLYTDEELNKKGVKR